MEKPSLTQLISRLGLIVLGVALGVLGCLVYWSFTSGANSNTFTQPDTFEDRLTKEDSSSVSDPHKSDIEQTELLDRTIGHSGPDFGNDPESAWNALLNDQVENIAQIEAFIGVASTWANQDGFNVIDRVRESLGFGVVANAVVLSVLHTAVVNDPHAAFQNALSLSSKSRFDALSSIVALWAKVTPLDTLEALNSAHLGGLRSELYEALIDSWTEKNPKSLLDNLASLPERLQQNAQLLAMFGVARISPPDAVEYLAVLPDDPNDDRRFSLAYEIAEHWSNIDARAALDWVSSVPFPGESNKRPQRMLLAKVLRNLVVEDANFAFQFAINVPLERFGHGLEPYVVSDIAHANTDKAISLLPHVRDGPTKAAAYRSVGRVLAEDGEYSRATDLGLELPDDQQSNYYCAVFSRWARANPDTLFQAIDQMPSSLVASQAAYNLLARHRNSGMLNKAEIQDLQDIVNASEHTLSKIATFTDSFGGNKQDREAEILQRELESYVVDQVYEFIDN